MIEIKINTLYFLLSNKNIPRNGKINFIKKFDYVSLMIGVNNQYSLKSIDTFRLDLIKLLGNIFSTFATLSRLVELIDHL